MIQVRQGTISEVVQLTRLIPEFENVYDQQEYGRRLDKCFHMILVAELDKEPVGFKVGYAMDQSVFYSWMEVCYPIQEDWELLKN